MLETVDRKSPRYQSIFDAWEKNRKTKKEFKFVQPTVNTVEYITATGDADQPVFLVRNYPGK